MLAYVAQVMRAVIEILFPSRCGINQTALCSPETFASCADRCFQSLRGTESIFVYRNQTARTAIWALKYEGNKRIARMLAVIAHDHLTDRLVDELQFNYFSSPVLIPLPISPERRKYRGWNQTELLADELSRLENARATADHQLFTTRNDILCKVRHTQPQTSLTRAERLANLKDCFAISEHRREFVRGRHFILLDDVATTGSTIYEARETLLRAGARKVIAFTIAH